MPILRNPFINRAMIRTPAQFFGRQREVARVTQRIAADPPQSVAIIGDRRIGKSSLLHYVSHPEVISEYVPDPERTLFLFLDMQEIRRPDVDAFFEGVGRHLEAAGDGLVDGYTPDYDGLQNVLTGLDRRGFRVLMLLDEFDRVTSLVKSFSPGSFRAG